MVNQLPLIFRGLNAVTTVGQARAVIGEALTAIGVAHELPDLTVANHRALEAARTPLQDWYRELERLRDDADYKAQFQKRRRLVEIAYIEISGVGGEADARRTISLTDELATSARSVATAAGSAAREITTATGDIAGGLLGGLLSGLGPVVVIVIAIAVYFAYFRRAAA